MMKTCVLLFLASFTLGFCLSYLISNPPANSPVIVQLKVADETGDHLAVSIAGTEESGSANRRTSLNQPAARRRPPLAYASAREVSGLDRAIRPASSQATAYQAPTTSNGPVRQGDSLAGLLLDAARYELDGRKDQRDMILASIFPVIIRDRINDPAEGGRLTAKTRSFDHDIIEKKQGPEKVREPVLASTRPASKKPAPLALVPTPVEAPPGTAAVEEPAETASAFRLVSVTFASKIRGPGDFEPLNKRVFDPGDRVLIYGEFEGFEEEPPQAEEDPTYTRSFSGRLRLVNTKAKLIDTFIFLEPSKATYRSEQRSGVVNFWARYKFPDDLPPGDYQVRVEGTDLIGGNEASTILGLRIREQGALPALRPEKLDASDLDVLPPYEEPGSSAGAVRNNTADSP